MRIAFVVYGSLDEISGGFIYDRALVGALRSLGHEVDVFGLRWHGYFHAVARSLVFGHPLRRPPDAARYDAVIQDELVHPSVFLANRDPGGWPRGRSMLTLVHNLRSRQPGEALAGFKARVERRYLGTVDGLICVCAATLADARALAGNVLPAVVIHPGRDHVTPDVDDALIEERSRAPGPLRVLYAGAVTRPKGLHRLLDALAGANAAIPGLAFTLDVVGRLAWPRYAREIRRQVARRGFEAQVRFHGERTGAALAALFRRSHVLALPSDREAYSLSGLEALGFGLPVLAPSAGGMREMVEPHREGFLLDPDDTEAWARALRLLAEDRGALRVMAGAAVARYRAHSTWREAAGAVAAFIARSR